MPGKSFHAICHTYPCPIHVMNLSACPLQAQKWNSAGNCIAVLVKFCIRWHSVHQVLQNLFATAARARNPSLPPALGGDAACAGSCRQAAPAGAGSVGAGASSVVDLQNFNCSERIGNQQNIWKSKFMRDIQDQQKTIPCLRRSAATICVGHFLDHRISNHVRCFARSVEDLQYTLANIYLVIDDSIMIALIAIYQAYHTQWG